MAVQILMPSLSPTMETGTLLKWLKKEGEEVKSGDLIAEIETDKATMEIESVDEGILGKILVEEGATEVPVNKAIGILIEEDEDINNFNLDQASKASPKSQFPNISAKEPEALDLKESKNFPKPNTQEKDRVLASPLARRMAHKNGIDLALLTGTGPKGRIIKVDVESAIKIPSEKIAKALEDNSKSQNTSSNQKSLIHDSSPQLTFMPKYTSKPVSSMRKIISQRLTSAAKDIPHFNLALDIEVDKLIETKSDLNREIPADDKITLNDLILKALGLALTRNPECNVSFTEEAILEYDRVDISFAVAVEGGLITPVIKNPAEKGLKLISGETRDLIIRAKAGKLKPEEYQGGTFTISNLGMYGIKNFNSIINTPQSGILSVGSCDQRPIVKCGIVKIATMMSVTLAIDHRCIDGAPAASLLNDLKAIIENPVCLML